ncbi:MAG: pyridoxamine 5'-phosphate oxidase family protein [Candidatus Omnitrophota bacterium]|nr:pyridoxamine 5'-phosphate oxidase family protein [Candidatus Omnitrophota bacterium]
MRRLSQDIIHFLLGQGYVVVSTIDRGGFPHSSCKGIVEITSDGQVYLLDVYSAKTYQNLKTNAHISITAVDEHKFSGYCLKGKAKIIPRNKLRPKIIRAWEARITSRLTQRLLRNIRGEKGHPSHPEALLPEPQYLIAVNVEEVVDLTPGHLK